jgi:DNA replication protein DnaC
MSTPSSPVLNSELVVALKRLKLGRIADTLPERLVLADKQEMTFDDLLLLVLTDEIARRDNTAAELRASEARLDPAMRLETWDKTSKVSFDKRMLAELTSLRFLEAHRHVVVLGPVGVGKTFVSQALGHIACRHGYHVHFTRADEMLRKLRQSRLDNSRDAEMIALTSVDMLIVDDFALEPMTKEESRDVYQLFLERTGRGSMIITSNRRHSRVARDVRRRAARAERRRPLQERGLRLRHGGRVVPPEAQAEARRRRTPATLARAEATRATTTPTLNATTPAGRLLAEGASGRVAA